MPYDQFGNWVDDVNDYINKNPKATDQELFKKFPQLGNDSNRLLAARSYGYAKEHGETQENLSKIYPEFNEQPRPGFIKENQTDLLAPQRESAQQRLNDITKTHADEAIEHLNKLDWQQRYQQLQSRSQEGGMSQEDIAATNAGLQNELFDLNKRKERVAQAKQNMQTNPEVQYDIQNTIGHLHPEVDKDIQKARYLAGTEGREANEKKILSNVDDIDKGKLIFKGGTLFKPLNTLESVVQVVKDHYNAIGESQENQKLTDTQLLKKYLDKRNAQNPDEPVPLPNAVGGFLGGQVPITATGVVTGAASVLFPESKIATPFLAALGLGTESYKATHSESLERNFNRFMNEGDNAELAMQKAKNNANFDAMADFAQMTAMGTVGAKTGIEPIRDFNPSETGLIKGIVNGAAKIAEKSTPEAAALGVIGGATQGAKNIHEGKDISEGMPEAILTNAALQFMIPMAVKGGKLLTSRSTYRTLLNTLGKIPEDRLSGAIDEQVKEGHISQDDGIGLKNDVVQQANVDTRIPPDITDQDSRNKIAKQITKADELEAEKKTAAKAYQPALKEKLDLLNQSILKSTEEGKKISKQKNQENALQKSKTESLLQYQSEESGIRGGERGGVEPGQQGEETTGTGQEFRQKEEVEPVHVRHADSTEDEMKPPIVSGRTQAPLGDKGKAQADQLAEDVNNTGINKIITSDLARSKETGQIVADKIGAATEARPELDSWDIGQFSKMNTSEFKKAQKFFVENPDEKEFEGKKLGESFNEYKDRVIKAHENLPEDPNTLVVNHSNNMVLSDAIKNNGGWNEAAKKEYLAMKPIPAAELPEMQPHEVTGTTDEETQALKEHGDEAAKQAIDDVSHLTIEDIKNEEKKVKNARTKTGTAASGKRKAANAEPELLRPVREGNQAETGHNELPTENELPQAARGTREPIQQHGEEKGAEPVQNEKNTGVGRTVEAAFAGGRIKGEVISEKGNIVRVKAKDGTIYPVEKRHILKEGESVVGHYDTKAKIRSGLGQILPRAGEAGDVAKYADSKTVLDEARQNFKGDKLINRTIDFLEPILKKNPNIKIDTEAKTADNELGLSYPDGKVAINFDRLAGNKDEMFRTMLHEFMHAATRSEIEKNPAFKEELNRQLEDIRKALKLPSGDVGDVLIPALVDRGLIDPDKYGASNAHELIAEVFSNQKFHDFLRGIQYNGDNLLHRIYTAIVRYFNQAYGSLANVKDKISASDMADYLMKLTEGVVKNSETDEAGVLKHIKPKQEDLDRDEGIRSVIRGIPDDVNKQDVYDAIKEQFDLPDSKIKELVREAGFKLTPEEKLSQDLKDIAKNKKTLDEKIAAANKFTEENHTKFESGLSKAQISLEQKKNKLKASAVAIKDAFVNKPGWSNMDAAINEFGAAKQKNDKQVMDFIKDAVKAVPKESRRNAITNWIEAGGDLDLLKERENASSSKYKSGYALAQHLTPSELQAAKTINDYFDSMLKLGMENGILKSQVENYMTHIGVKKNNPVANSLMTDIMSGKINTSFRYARERTYATFFDLEAAGYSARTKDFANILGVYSQTFNKAIYSRAFIKNASAGKASDGRPLITQAGFGKQILNKEWPLMGNGPSEAMLVNPFGKPEEYHDYKPINHFALRDWYWATKDNYGNPVFAKGDLVVHPEEYERLGNILGKSILRDNIAGRAALGASNIVKQSVFAISPFFHYVQLGTHGIGHGINPFSDLPEIDFNNPVHVKALEHGLRLFDYDAQSGFAEGLTAGNLFKNIPIYNKIILPLQEHLFNSYQPRLKMKTFVHAIERNLSRNADAIKSGKISDDAIWAKTAEQMNAAYGHLNYDIIGRNKTTQDIFRMLAIAPDFLEARARFVGQALTWSGKEQRMALAVLGVSMYVTARILNKAIDDDYHWDEPFSVIHGGKKYRLRSVPEDIWEMYHDFGRFMYNRISPLGQGILEGVTKYDPVRRRQVDYDEVFKDAITSPIPAAAKEFLPDSWNKFTGKPEHEKLWDSFINTLGVRESKYFTATEQGVVDNFYKRFPKGEPTIATETEKRIYKENEEGNSEQVEKLLQTLTPSQQRSIIRNLVSKKSQYESMFQRLPIEDKIKLYKKMTDEEKSIYDPIGKVKYQMDLSEQIKEQPQEVEP